MAHVKAASAGKGRHSPLTVRGMLWLFAALWLAGDPIYRGDARLGYASSEAKHGLRNGHPNSPAPNDRHDAIAVLEARDDAVGYAVIEPTGNEPTIGWSFADLKPRRLLHWKPLAFPGIVEESTDTPYSPRAPPAVAV